MPCGHEALGVDEIMDGAGGKTSSRGGIFSVSKAVVFPLHVVLCVSDDLCVLVNAERRHRVISQWRVGDDNLSFRQGF